MTVPSTWPWELVHLRPHLTSRYIIRRVRRTISRENSRKIHSWKSGYSTCLKSWWKFELRKISVFFRFLKISKISTNYIFATSARIMIFITRRQKSDWTWIINWRISFFDFATIASIFWIFKNFHTWYESYHMTRIGTGKISKNWVILCVPWVWTFDEQSQIQFHVT